VDCDAIVHLAAVSTVIACDEDPAATFRTNITGSYNIARLAYGRRVIFASSLTASEPNSSYSESKRLVEPLFPVVLRMGNVIGGNDPSHTHVLPTLVRAAMCGTTFTITSTLESSRHYINVDDVCSAFELLLQRGYGIFDCCYKEATTLSTMIALVEAETQRPIQRTMGKMRPGEAHVWAGNSRALHQLGWNPWRSLRESVKQAVYSYRAAT
ncbi:MAG: NAD-dependent epimerase/dehydratase family protein, partial [Planctomycetales bacterium]|nr:NAD-dependent epimerase/dehydratase family protein [Planctomycetales bacterium]